MAEPMLKIDNIDVYYGAIHALKGISLEVNEGEIVTLIGANGAGKSTTLRTISGLLKPKTGSITFLGQSIAGVRAHEIVKKGISQVPEGRRIYAEMTVMEHRALGTTVLLIEQNANMALSIANRAYVLETGRITLSGKAQDLAASEDVRKAYLGG